MVPVNVEAATIDRVARAQLSHLVIDGAQTARDPPAPLKLRHADTQPAQTPLERRTLQRHQDFVMVPTGGFAKNTAGDMVKSAVILRAKREGTSVASANRSMTRIPSGGQHQLKLRLPSTVLENGDSDSDESSYSSVGDEARDVTHCLDDVLDGLCEPIATVDSDLDPLSDVEPDTDEDEDDSEAGGAGAGAGAGANSDGVDDPFAEYAQVDDVDDSDSGSGSDRDSSDDAAAGFQAVRRTPGSPVVPRQLLVPKGQYNTRLQLKFGRAESKGQRKTMEDVTMSLPDMGKAVRFPAAVPAHAFFGVYDGHNGDDTSVHLGHLLHFNLAATPGFVDDPKQALDAAFKSTDADIVEGQVAKDATGDLVQFSGSTALVCVVREAPAPCDAALADAVPSDAAAGPCLYVANAGDCRAVLSRKGRAVELSTDHTASLPEEQERIVRAGGWVHGGRLHGVLAVSRAFGDVEHKVLKEKCWERPYTADPLIPDPDVRVEPLRADDEFLVMACDGLWDVLSSQQAVNFVRRRLVLHGDVGKAAHELVQKALRLYSHDNVSAVIVAFHQSCDAADAYSDDGGGDDGKVPDPKDLLDDVLDGVVDDVVDDDDSDDGGTFDDVVDEAGVIVDDDDDDDDDDGSETNNNGAAA